MKEAQDTDSRTLVCGSPILHPMLHVYPSSDGSVPRVECVLPSSVSTHRVPRKKRVYNTLVRTRGRGRHVGSGVDRITDHITQTTTAATLAAGHLAPC